MEELRPIPRTKTVKDMITILTIAQAREILAEHGMSVSEVHIRAGIECGVYDFGRCIPAAKSRTFEVYKGKLIRWIKDHADDEEAV